MQATSKGSDKTARMHRLIWGFAGRTYHIVGNLMPWLNIIINSYLAILKFSQKSYIFQIFSIKPNNVLFKKALHCTFQESPTIFFSRKPYTVLFKKALQCTFQESLPMYFSRKPSNVLFKKALQCTFQESLPMYFSRKPYTVLFKKALQCTFQESPSLYFQ